MNSVFIMPRKGLVGGSARGADYMQSTTARAKRMEAADRPQTCKSEMDERQMDLPFVRVKKG